MSAPNPVSAPPDYSSGAPDSTEDDLKGFQSGDSPELSENNHKSRRGIRAFFRTVTGGNSRFKGPYRTAASAVAGGAVGAIAVGGSAALPLAGIGALAYPAAAGAIRAAKGLHTWGRNARSQAGHFTEGVWGRLASFGKGVRKALSAYMGLALVLGGVATAVAGGPLALFGIPTLLAGTGLLAWKGGSQGRQLLSRVFPLARRL